MNPLSALQEEYWFNWYPGKSERGPIMVLELRHKQSGEKSRFPIWNSKEPNKGPYLGKMEEPRPVAHKSSDDLTSDTPF